MGRSPPPGVVRDGPLGSCAVTRTRWQHLALASLVGVAALAGCGDDGDDTGQATSTTSSVAAPDPSPTDDTMSPEQREIAGGPFCAALDIIGSASDPATLEPAYDEMLRTAPPELADDVATFVEQSRQIAEVFSQLPPDATEVDIAEATATLPPDVQQVVSGVLEYVQTGEPPEGPYGNVLRYGADDCGLAP